MVEFFLKGLRVTTVGIVTGMYIAGRSEEEEKVKERFHGDRTMTLVNFPPRSSVFSSCLELFYNM